MAYTTINKPSDYFNTVLYTGNGSTQSITGVGFQPDMVWTKNRSSATNHYITDVVRGATETLRTNTTGAESTQSGGLTSFDSDGFSIGSDNAINQSGNNLVGWSWLAGGTASENTQGDITSQVSANTTAGFSIVSYTGTGSDGTIGHGLGATPDIMIIKDRDSGTSNWVVYTTLIDGSMDYLILESTSAKGDSGATAPTSTLINIPSGTNVNASGNRYIAYCFANKKGFSKFGTYTGNGSADGTFVYTGFKPAFFMMKRTDSTGEWKLVDNKRFGYNPSNRILAPNDSAAEQTDDNIFDIVSNGIKIRNSGAALNASGGSFIYMAFAENPLVTTGKIPATAR